MKNISVIRSDAILLAIERRKSHNQFWFGKMLKCNLCGFSTKQKKRKTLSNNLTGLAKAAYRRSFENNIRIHLKEEHAESLPQSTVDKGIFFKENIIYLDEKGNEEPKIKSRGRPKKRKRAASWAPGKEKTGDFC